jgi:site-specific DNA-methyltransferase (adenine-specific)
VRDRRRTSTSNFGVSGRESHDASGFYERFRPPLLSEDRTILEPLAVEDPFQLGDARAMDAVADGSVALVVTSPPYFAGKRYEEELERDGVPASYLEYLELLTAVFAECVAKLEPGGRIAVNVANLGRKPYRSLAADVIGILGDELGLLLRGEVVWQKGEGANGSCAWGSFRSASNPVLRDVTERVIVASKGRFDRALSVKDRAQRGLPHESTISTDDFLALTLDVWSIPPESARRVGHPAPFPVELPAQLIRLLTFRDDLVLDPFMGSGSTLVAASSLGRRFVGYDLDPDYVALARARVAAEGALLAEPEDDGRSAGARCLAALEQAGFSIEATERRVPRTAVIVDAVARDATGTQWHVDFGGAATSGRPGLHRPEVAFRALGRLSALRGRLGPAAPLLVLTTAAPEPRSESEAALRAAGPGLLVDVVDVSQPDALGRLERYAAGERSPLLGFWQPTDLA